MTEIRSEQGRSAVLPVASSDGVAGLAGPTVAPGPGDLEQIVQRNFARNAVAIVGWEATWAMGMAFAIMGVLIPSYLAVLEAPKTIVGLLSAIGYLMIPAMLLSEPLLGGPRRKRNLILAYVVAGVALLVCGGISLVIPTEQRAVLIVVFAAAVVVFSVGASLGGPQYSAMLTDNTPMLRRGRLYGWRAAALGLCGVLMAAFAHWLLGHFKGPAASQVAMLVGGALYACSLGAVACFRDIRGADAVTDVVPQATIRKVWMDIRAALLMLYRSPNYRVFIFFEVMLVAATTLQPFVVYAARDLMSPAPLDASLFNMVHMASMIVNGIFIALVADRFGYRLTMMIQAVLAMLAFAAILSFPRLETVLLGYALLACVATGLAVVLLNLSVEIMPQVPTAHLVAVGSLLTLIPSTLLPLFAGSVLDFSGRKEGGFVWGYYVVFSIGATLALVGGLGTWWLVQEPRTGRVYEIKTLVRS